MAAFAFLKTVRTDVALTSGVDYPASSPAFQAGWDTFSPPVSAGNPTGPLPSVVTNDADSGDAVQLAGYSFTSTTGFSVYGQTTNNNGTLAAGSLLNDPTTYQLANVVLPSSLPSKSMYLIWPTGPGSRLGPPIRVNAPEAWWCLGTSGNRCVVGDTVSVHGINLCNGAGTPLSWAYLECSGQAAYVSTTSVNANGKRAQFTMPSTIGSHTLVNGDVVTIWVNNGHGNTSGGLHRGWAKCSQQITVRTTTTIGGNGTNQGTNYTDYNSGTPVTASGTDDTTTIQNIINASTVPTRIVLAAGTFKFSSQLTMESSNGSSILIEGQGTGSTTLSMTSGYTSGANYFASVLGPPNIAPTDCHSGFKNLTIDMTGKSFVKGVIGHVHRLTNVNMVSSGIYMMATNQGNLVMDTCDWTGASIVINQMIGVSINNVTLRLTDAPTEGLSNAGIQTVYAASVGMSLTNITMRNLNDAIWADTGVRALYFADNSAQIYVDNLNTINLGPASSGPGSPTQDLNKGELLSFENAAPAGNEVVYSTGCLFDNSSGVTKILFPASATFNSGVVNFIGTGIIGTCAAVIAGKGMWQTAGVTAIDSVNKTVTLDRKWRVDIDATSNIEVTIGRYHIAVGNTSGTSVIQGNNRTDTAGTMFNFNCFCHEMYFDGLKATNLGKGMTILMNVSGAMTLWSLIKNTTFDHCNVHMFAAGGNNKFVVLRNVLAENTLADGFTAKSWLNNPYGPVYYLLDKCTWQDTPIGFTTLVNDATGVLAMLSNTIFKLGNATLAGSQGYTTEFVPATNFILSGTSAIENFATRDFP